MSLATDITTLTDAIRGYGTANKVSTVAVNKGIINSYRESVRKVDVIDTPTSKLDCSLSNNIVTTLKIASAKLLLDMSGFTAAGTGKTVNYSLTLDVVKGIAGAIVDWSGINVTWQDGIAPVQTTTINKTDTFILRTADGGASWSGYISGTNR